MTNRQRTASDRAWSDEELDLALAGLFEQSRQYGAPGNLGPGITVQPILPAGSAPRTVKPRRRWPVLAAVAAVVAVATIVVPSMLTQDAAPHADATAALNRAASAAITNQDQVVGPGQYRFVETVGIGVMTTTTQTPNADSVIHQWQRWNRQQWIPADPNEVWMDRQPTSETAPLVPGKPLDTSALRPIAGSAPAIATSACGDFWPSADPATSSNYCTAPGGWQVPTAKWLAGLPTDAGTMYQLMRDATAGRGRSPNAEMLVYAADALGTGMIPAGKRSLIYGALARIPGIAIVDAQANLNGQKGIAFSVDEAGVTTQIVIDPATGNYIGQRDVLIEDQPQGVTGADGAEVVFKAGMVVSSTAVSVGIADQLGVVPTRR